MWTSVWFSQGMSTWGSQRASGPICQSRLPSVSGCDEGLFLGSGQMQEAHGDQQVLSQSTDLSTCAETDAEWGWGGEEAGK